MRVSLGRIGASAVNGRTGGRIFGTESAAILSSQESAPQKIVTTICCANAAIDRCISCQIGPKPFWGADSQPGNVNSRPKVRQSGQVVDHKM